MVDSSSLVGNIRLIKDDAEIQILKKSCEISADAHVEIMKTIKPWPNRTRR
jgi:Xaa-Pro aminopeptidase